MKRAALCLSIVLALCLSASAQTLPADADATVAADQATYAKLEARDSFHKNVIEQATKLVRDGKMTRRDLLKLRVAMLAPGFREKAEDLAVIQMAASGSDAIPVGEDGRIDRASIDWDKVLAFIEKLIPLLLQLIDAFGSINQLDIQVNSAGMPLYAIVSAGSATFVVAA